MGQGADDVHEFGVSTHGHTVAISYLKEQGIKRIAMESTGSYWQSLFNVLQEAGFELLLVPGNKTKNARIKTDVKDCQWIQNLHTLGMLTGSFFCQMNKRCEYTIYPGIVVNSRDCGQVHQ